MGTGKMSIYSNREIYESVCKKESACGECILKDAQNMTEVVCQLGLNALVKHSEAGVSTSVF